MNRWLPAVMMFVVVTAWMTITVLSGLDGLSPPLRTSLEPVPWWEAYEVQWVAWSIGFGVVAGMITLCLTELLRWAWRRR